MVVLLFVRHREDDFYIRIEALHSIPFEVGRGFEADSIGGWQQGLCGGQKLFAAAIDVGRGFVNERPCVVLQAGETDRNSAGRASKGDVENVCRDAHNYSDSSQR